MRAEAAELGAEPRLHGSHEHGAEERSERGAEAADDGGKREPNRQVDREDVERIDEPDVLRPERAADRRQGRARRDRCDLEPARPDTERERRILFFTPRRKLEAAARAL